MLKYKTLPQHIEAVFIQNILKLFGRVVEQREAAKEYDEIDEVCTRIEDKLTLSLKSAELEVQERASTTIVIIQIVKDGVQKRKYGTIVFF